MTVVSGVGTFTSYSAESPVTLSRIPGQHGRPRPPVGLAPCVASWPSRPGSIQGNTIIGRRGTRHCFVRRYVTPLKKRVTLAPGPSEPSRHLATCEGGSACLDR